MKKLTKWLVGKPERPGLYERKLPRGGNNRCFAWWNGEFWGGFAVDKDQAVNNGHVRSGWQTLYPYRGFTTEQTKGDPS